MTKKRKAELEASERAISSEEQTSIAAELTALGEELPEDWDGEWEAASTLAAFSQHLEKGSWAKTLPLAPSTSSERRFSKEEEADWMGTLALLRHAESPVSLTERRRRELKSELLTAWSIEARAHSVSWWERLWSSVAFRPMVAAFGVACFLAVGVASWDWNRGAFVDEDPTLTVASRYESPWKPGENPFHTTKNSTERLDRVVRSLREQRQVRWLALYRSRKTRR